MGLQSHRALGTVAPISTSYNRVHGDIYNIMETIVRPAVAADAHDIGSLAQQFADYLRKLGDETELKLTADKYLQDGFGDQPAFAGIVAERDGKVIGYLLYHIGYDSDAAGRNLHIADLFVDVKMRRQGVGTALIKAAAGIARKAGALELIWSVYQANELAADFYEKMGARPITDVVFMKLHADAL